MPSNAQARYDSTAGSIEVTWGPPTDADPNATLTYEVRRDDVVVYMGGELSFVDASPAAVVVYTITAYDGSSHGAAAITVGVPVDLGHGYPHCLDIVYFDPLPVPIPHINWDCLFPLP
ncbi:MAG: hypothetical protein ABR586_03925, partial [Thermoplasmatota archaeon]